MKAVLMVAHADREALERTLDTGEMHFRSRTRGLWRKGETSGNVQRVVSLSTDCDGDAVLARVAPAGPACHTGTISCFGKAALAPDALFIEGGRLETRAEYESNHLPADIEFERAVNGKRSPLRITFNSDTAWVIATTEFEGTFENAPVNFVSAQLMVLTRDNGPWTIRTIHWSSYRR